jgi:hypothetical protein
MFQFLLRPWCDRRSPRPAPRQAAVAVFCVACGATPPLPLSHEDVALVSEPRHARLEVALPQGDGVDFVLYLPLPSGQPARLALPDVWGGRSGFADAITELRVSFDGEDLPWSRPDRGSLHTGPTPRAGTLEIRWRCVPDRRTFDASSTFRAVRLDDSLWLPSHACVLVPEPALAPDGLRVELAVDAPITFSLPLDAPVKVGALRETAFTAGPWTELLSNAADGTPIRILTPTTVRARSLQPLRPALSAAHAAVGPLVGDAMPSTLTVFILPHDDPTRLSGYGRVGGYVLELGEQRGASEEELLAVAAHEQLHLLIGHSLRFAADDEFQTLWFREGVTDFLALQALVRSGALPPSRLFSRLGEAVTFWRANPARERPIADAAAWGRDADARRLPYDEGFLRAAAMDVELRRADLSLSAWLDRLRADADRLVRADRLRATLAELGPAGESLAEWLDPGAEIPFFATFERAGLRLVERYETLPWYGLRIGQGLDGASRVVSVDADSPAAAAGLRPGDEIVEGGTRREVSGPWRLRARTSAGWVTVTLHPARGMVRRWHVEEVSAGGGRYLRSFGIETPRRDGPRR